ncbi:MAG: cupin domain-containing protein, partial [Terriglobia bacterium]
KPVPKLLPTLWIPRVTCVESALVIVKEGTIEAELNDQPRRVEAGSVLFVAANDLYGVRNPTDAPATYYVIKFLSN